MAVPTKSQTDSTTDAEAALPRLVDSEHLESGNALMKGVVSIPHGFGHDVDGVRLGVQEALHAEVDVQPHRAVHAIDAGNVASADMESMNVSLKRMERFWIDQVRFRL